MNRGVLQSSPPVQQIMAGNPNWWNINTMRPPPYQHLPSPFLPPPNLFPHFPSPSSSSSSSSLTIPSWLENTSTTANNNQDQLPESWSQLPLGGLVDEDKGNMMSQFEAKNNNWEEQMLHQAVNSSVVSPVVDVKQENSANNFVYGGHATTNEDFHALKPNCWSQMIPPSPAATAAVSSPKSCLTSFSSNMLDFSTNKADCIVRHPPPDRSSECNSSATGGAVKKARVQPSSTPQSTFKVRKEKLGDRITALHQLVSPFGKTDTASVLLEAIGYIRFLQSQIEALSLPYLGASASSNIRHQQQPVQGERNCMFPEDPGQLLNDSCLKRKGGSDQQEMNEDEGHNYKKKDLRSRGLCLVPVACTLQVGSENGADYWAPALGGGFR